ncbi:hypothetical protein GCM10025768_26950 [Microbacterium pseudoresistens]|uniref:Potassium transporter Trk n=1 Tax=Microbacterium pseudoresistens TaxID=640634 RepID=A0A7Y9ETU2_9MICO|nr:potassium transporter Trk [Microbacterium pseudoresistens]NYD53808.1 hypothetical protein [Microbacterium pseudoresistens]
MSSASQAASGERVEARVRRAPRIGVFLALGAIAGIVVAGILTLTGSYEPSEVLDVVYPPMQVFGFLLLWTVPLGLGLGGLVAVVIDRVTRRRSHIVQVDRETVSDAE